MEENQQSHREKRRAYSGGNGAYGYANNYGPSGAPGYGSSAYGPAGYGYGGYGGQGDTTVQRSLQDYILILRERLWYIVVAFVVVLASTALYTFSLTPLYQSTATVELFRRAPTVMQGQQLVDSDLRSAEDINTQVNILKSSAIVERVAARLTGPDLDKFLAPYRKPKTPNPSAVAILTSNRDIVPVRASLDVSINYKHPDPQVAAKVANLFSDEYIAYNSRLRVAEAMRTVQDFQEEADKQRKKVDEIQHALQDYREKNNLISLDQRKDINTEKLKELSTRNTQTLQVLQEAETRYKQLLATRGLNEPLVNLPFIASDANVTAQLQSVAAARNKVAELSQRYRALYPDMGEAVKSLSSAESELNKAVDRAASQVESEYKIALTNNTKAADALRVQETASLTMDRYGLDYVQMERDFDVNDRILQETLAKMRTSTMTGSVETQSARPLDDATPSGTPVSPNRTLNLGLGAIGGLGLGVTLAFLVAFIDDRIKSTFDIEAVVGLPLISIIPKFEKASKGEQTANAFTAPAEREVLEAFSTLYSAVRVKEADKIVQCILVTSTIPGEGKSFIARNLAMSFASHGEKTVLIDCDLRRPVVHRAFEMENLKGVIDLCAGSARLDDVLVKEAAPNMDVLPSGGRSKNPAQNLSSKNFEVVLSELRKRYQRIIIDTPPVALVSDALVLLPLTDGTIYSIFFNKVRRKAAQFCVQRLLEVNVTHFGAVLNGLDQNLGGYYYHHYYDKKYRGYYAAAEDDDAAAASNGKPVTGNGAKKSHSRRTTADVTVNPDGRMPRDSGTSRKRGDIIHQAMEKAADAPPPVTPPKPDEPQRDLPL